MVYISIGHRCDVKYQIDKHNHKIETLFFDWLMTSMASVIEILSCDDINKILCVDNIIRDASNPYQDDKSRMIIKSLNSCVSVHDVPRNFTKKDILDFIDKYKRRFDRIIKYIKSEEKIYFIRNDSIDAFTKQNIDEYTRQTFIDTILKINPKCNFALVIIDNNTINTPGIIKYDHCLHIKINYPIPSTYHWTKEHLQWGKIFSDIKNNI